VESGHVGQEFGLVATPVTTRESGLMRDVNLSMRRIAGTFAEPDPVIFFCECRVANCYAPVTMTAEAFDEAMVQQAAWLLVAGHEPSVTWSRAGEPPDGADPQSQEQSHARRRHSPDPVMRGWRASFGRRFVRRRPLAGVLEPLGAVERVDEAIGGTDR